MDTKTLLADAKARFNHNSAKAYLAEKYNAKLIVAEQNGLWKADAQTISMLSSLSDNESVVLIDTFNNPVKVNRIELLVRLKQVYNTTMEQWHIEWQESESKR